MISHASNEMRSRWALPLLRVMTGATVELSVQSENGIFFELHWLEKNYVCPGDDCPACADNVARVKGYFCALVSTGSGWQPVLVEATPSGVTRLYDQLRLEGCELKSGVRVTAFRRAKNRPVLFNLSGEAGPVDSTLSGDYRTLSACAVLFGLPLPERDEILTDYGARAVPVARNQLIVAVRRGR